MMDDHVSPLSPNEPAVVLEKYWDEEEFTNAIDIGPDGAPHLAEHGREERLLDVHDTIEDFYVDYLVALDFAPNASPSQQEMFRWQNTRTDITGSAITVTTEVELMDTVTEADDFDELCAAIETLRESPYFAETHGTLTLEYIVHCPACNTIKERPTRAITSPRPELQGRPLPADESRCETCDERFTQPEVPREFKFQFQHLFHQPTESPEELIRRLDGFVYQYPTHSECSHDFTLL